MVSHVLTMFYTVLQHAAASNVVLQSIKVFFSTYLQCVIIGYSRFQNNLM